MSLSFVKILPAIFYAGNFSKRKFQGGIDSISNIFDSLVRFVIPNTGYELEIQGFESTNNISWHEVNFFIGIIGLSTILIFFIYCFKNNTLKKMVFNHLRPLIVILIFSFSANFYIFYYFDLPFSNSIRFPSRFFIIFVTFVMLISIIGLNNFLKKNIINYIDRALYLALLIFPLLLNFSFYEIKKTNLSNDQLNSIIGNNWRLEGVTNYFYEFTVIVSFIISISTLAYLTFLLLNKKNV